MRAAPYAPQSPSAPQDIAEPYHPPAASQISPVNRQLHPNPVAKSVSGDNQEALNTASDDKTTSYETTYSQSYSQPHRVSIKYTPVTRDAVSSAAEASSESEGCQTQTVPSVAATTTGQEVATSPLQRITDHDPPFSLPTNGAIESRHIVNQIPTGTDAPFTVDIENATAMLSNLSLQAAMEPASTAVTVDAVNLKSPDVKTGSQKESTTIEVDGMPHDSSRSKQMDTDAPKRAEERPSPTATESAEDAGDENPGRGETGQANDKHSPLGSPTNSDEWTDISQDKE